MKLKEIPRTATFAWSPSASAPAVVTGTAAGAIDPDFSTRTTLDLWSLDLKDRSVGGLELTTPDATVETDARFHDLAVNPRGDLVAGALENGIVQTWKLKAASGSAPAELVSQGRGKTGGAVHSVAFSRLTGKLASGSAGGQVLVWDPASDLSKPVSPDAQHNARHDDVSSVAWNNSAPHILASAGTKGFTSIWDVGRRREVLHLHYTGAAGQRVPVSAVQWHPTDSTRLLTTSGDDNEPVVLLWNLRNVNSPEKVLRGHTRGVLSADWCFQDPALLLTGGRDNATMLWNPESGERLGSYPIAVEWAFKTRFHPTVPEVFATASFDGKVTVQTLQDTTSDQPTVTEGDFWAQAAVMDSAHFTLHQAPRWLQRPISARFGFGGKIAVAKESGVFVTKVVDPLGPDTSAFGDTVKAGDWAKLVADGADWDQLRKLLDGEPLLDTETEPNEASDELPIVKPAPGGPFEASDYVSAAVLRGDLRSAVARLLTKGEAGDALLLSTFASGSSEELVEAAQTAYVSEHGEKPYLRIAALIHRRDIAGLAQNCNLDAWPSIVAAAKRFGATAEAAQILGGRLSAAGDRDAAVKAYLAGGAVGAASALWVSELPQLEAEAARQKDTTAYAAHVRALQQVVAKITVALKVSDRGTDTTGDKANTESDAMHGSLREFANIAASQGDLALAKVYLDMLPEKYSQDKDRIHKATAPITATTSRTTPRGYAPAVAPAAPTPAMTSTASATPYNAAPTVPKPNAYAGNPYAPSATMNAPQPVVSSQRVPNPASVVAPPPPPPTVPTVPTVPTAAPSSTPKRVSHGWNDLPELAAPQRRRTPAAPQIISPPPVASSTVPIPASNNNSRRPSKAVPPPPKVGEKPQSAAPSMPVTPAPMSPVSAAPGPPLPAVAPGASSGQVFNPYVPKAAPVAATPEPVVPLAPVPGPKTVHRVANRAKPNPYAPSPSSTPAPGPGAGISPTHGLNSGAPPPPPAVGVVPPPPVGGRNVTPAQTAPPPAPHEPPMSQVPAKYPRGDRSHISPANVSVFHQLQHECDRVRPVVDAKYHKQLVDTQRRLNILFDHLNNDDLLQEDTQADMRQLAANVAAHDYNAAMQIATQLLAERSEQCGEWMTGVRRLIQMGSAVPDSA